MISPIKDSDGNIIYQSAPFASKKVPEGSLYRRKHGESADCLPGVATSIRLVVPYDCCLIDEVEVINCEALDTVDMKVFSPTDPSAAAAYGLPPATLLNQFGYDVYVSDIYYTDTSNYDAKLCKDFEVEILYKNNGTTTKKIGVNFVLHEIKPPQGI